MAEEWGPWIERGDATRLFGVFVGDVLQAEATAHGKFVRSEEEVVTSYMLGLPLVGEYGEVHRWRVRRPDALRNLIDLAEQVEDLTPETVKALVGV